MTRDDQRAAIIRAIQWILSIYLRGHSEEWYERAATAAFDAQHDLARVNPIEATEEMRKAADNAWQSTAGYDGVWRDMSAAGDLTNGPEGKT